MIPVLGIIGGTGFYTLLEDVDEVTMDTPHGRPSAPVSIGRIDGRAVAFLPRHGRNHSFLPSDVPYAANLAALKQVGAKQILGFNTVGSLQRNYRRGDFVVTNQFVDRTRRRKDTIFNGEQGAHISSAYPYCDRLRATAIAALTEAGVRAHPEGTVVVIEGPRFSSAAESRWFSAQGWNTINMTQYPEVVLAREMQLCYANVSYVTDYDVAAKEVVESDVAVPVSHHEVLRAFAAGSPAVMKVIRAMVARLDASETHCSCASALEEALT
ncbi:MAG: MTAP family purine nucleoside phosphorylase [Geminicoccaceae bacterium]